MALTKVLIAVKTYPTLSKKYDELVCTAGFKEDGSWVRIYPIPYRKLNYHDQQYKKWQWVEIDLVKNDKDFRRESYRPVNIDAGMKLLSVLDTKNNWAERKKYALKNVYTNLSTLINEALDPNIGTSLGVLKPKEIIDFVWEPVAREWDKAKYDAVIANMKQGNLFEQEKFATDKLFQIAKKVPYKFSYIFVTDDNKKRKLMIEDWEVGMLYWNCLKSCNYNEQMACKKVKERYFDDFVNNCDMHFLMGTTWKFHNMQTDSPFVIIGLFNPRKEKKKDAEQLTLFDL